MRIRREQRRCIGVAIGRGRVYVYEGLFSGGLCAIERKTTLKLLRAK